MRNERNIETGKRLKEALKLRGMKQNELANAVHLTPVTINNICSGRAALTLGNAHEFAELLDIDYKYLTLESDYLTELDAMSKRWDDMTTNIEKKYNLRSKISAILEDSDYAFKDVKEITGREESIWITYTHPDGSRRFARDDDFIKLIQDIAWYITAASERFVAEHERTIENVTAKYAPDYIPKEPTRQPVNDSTTSTPFVFE